MSASENDLISMMRKLDGSLVWLTQMRSAIANETQILTSHRFIGRCQTLGMIPDQLDSLSEVVETDTVVIGRMRTRILLISGQQQLEETLPALIQLAAPYVDALDQQLPPSLRKVTRDTGKGKETQTKTTTRDLHKLRRELDLWSNWIGDTQTKISEKKFTLTQGEYSGKREQLETFPNVLIKASNALGMNCDGAKWKELVQSVATTEGLSQQLPGCLEQTIVYLNAVNQKLQDTDDIEGRRTTQNVTRPDPVTSNHPLGEQNETAQKQNPLDPLMSSYNSKKELSELRTQLEEWASWINERLVDMQDENDNMSQLLYLPRRDRLKGFPAVFEKTAQTLGWDPDRISFWKESTEVLKTPQNLRDWLPEYHKGMDICRSAVSARLKELERQEGKGKGIEQAFKPEEPHHMNTAGSATTGEPSALAAQVPQYHHGTSTQPERLLVAEEGRQLAVPHHPNSAPAGSIGTSKSNSADVGSSASTGYPAITSRYRHLEPRPRIMESSGSTNAAMAYPPMPGTTMTERSPRIPPLPRRQQLLPLRTPSSTSASLTQQSLLAGGRSRRPAAAPAISARQASTSSRRRPRASSASSDRPFKIRVPARSSTLVTRPTESFSLTGNTSHESLPNEAGHNNTDNAPGYM